MESRPGPEGESSRTMPTSSEVSVEIPYLLMLKCAIREE